MANKRSVVPLGEIIHVRDNLYKIRQKRENYAHAQYAYYLKVPCCICGTEVLRDASNIRRNPDYKNYCSDSCNVFGKTGENNKQWSGGLKYKRGGKGGHILQYSPTHPKAKKGFVHQHRLVVENNIGRYLEDEELIHHIDCNPENNDFKNLTIMNRSQHSKAHCSLEKCVQKLMEMGVLIYNESEFRYETK